MGILSSLQIKILKFEIMYNSEDFKSFSLSEVCLVANRYSSFVWGIRDFL